MDLFNKPLLYGLLLAAPPLLGLFVNVSLCKNKTNRGALVSTFGIWIAFINALIAWFAKLPFYPSQSLWGIHANEIAWVMATLILFISAVVHQFSIRYMAGDRQYRRYFLLLTSITISALLMVAADNAILLVIVWGISNGLLALLMMHKSQWMAAKQSAILTLKTLILGLALLSAGIGLMAFEFNTLSITTIAASEGSQTTRFMALSLIILAALAQSGGWPFHRWLLSSLNSPTPVSALMHAGLVNGGGFILVSFAPIFLRDQIALTMLFLLASVSLILGGMWKLVQADVKRMLACSTMTQLGFMSMQCGLGFFPAALAHLCWHGLFKAHLFLRSGSAIHDNPQSNEISINGLFPFLCALGCGTLGVGGFMVGTGLYPHSLETSLILLFFCWMASIQLAMALLAKKFTIFSVLAACFACLSSGLAYGLTVNVIESAVGSMPISQPQPLTGVHVVVTMVVFFVWMILNVNAFNQYAKTKLWKRLYVVMLNASQPHPSTIAVNTNRYKFEGVL